MILFKKLWDNYPRGDFPCSMNGKSNFENQCAIRIGVCFKRSGINTSNWPARKCWYHKSEEGHVLSAQELANSLNRVVLPGLGKVEKFSGKNAFDKINGRSGIIFIQNYYGTGNQGDHIDLWNGSRLTDWLSWLRIHASLSIPGVWSDYRGAQSIWFWQVI